MCLSTYATVYDLFMQSQYQILKIRDSIGFKYNVVYHTNQIS